MLIANELGSRDVQAYALKNQRHAFSCLRRLAEAAYAYRQALDIRRELGEPKLATALLAGLARISLTEENQTQAQAYVQEILSFLEQNIPASGSGDALDGTDAPLRVYLTCYRVMDATQDPRAQRLLIAAHNLLQERAGKIRDKLLLRSYLEDVTPHREIIAAYRELQTRQSGSQVTLSLPRADAPSGRPLREDKYVSVTWTIVAPRDDDIPGKGDRRRLRLLRLLSEAADQGAAPTMHDLAGRQAIQCGILCLGI